MSLPRLPTALPTALAAAVLSALSGGPALALTCQRPSVELAFLEAQQSDDAYLVVHGRLDFNPAEWPRSGPDDQFRTETVLGASFVGLALTGTGFNARFAQQIWLRVGCLDSRCGQAVPGGEYLVFLERTSRGYVLELGVCDFWAFAEPDTAMLDRAHRCLLGEGCDRPGGTGP